MEWSLGEVPLFQGEGKLTTNARISLTQSLNRMDMGQQNVSALPTHAHDTSLLPPPYPNVLYANNGAGDSYWDMVGGR